MVFACLQIFRILCSQVILVKRSASLLWDPDVLGTFGGQSISWSVPNFIRPKALTTSPGEIAWGRGSVAKFWRAWCHPSCTVYLTSESLVVCWSFGDLDEMGCHFVCWDWWSGGLRRALGSTETAEKSPAYPSEVHSNCWLFPFGTSCRVQILNKVASNIWISWFFVLAWASSSMHGTYIVQTYEVPWG